MNQPLEDSVAATYRARASTVRDAPGLAERAIARGRRVRRQRRAYGGLAVVAAVAVAVGTPTLLTGRDAVPTPGLPVATPTGRPSPVLPPGPQKSVKEIPRPWDDLPLGAATEVPFSIGSRIFGGDEIIKLPNTHGDPIEFVHAIDGGYVVEVAGFDAIPGTVAIVDNRRFRQLARGPITGLAVGADGGQAAWGEARVRTDPSRTTLTVVSLPDGAQSAHQTVNGSWGVVGMAEGRLVLTQRVDPGVAPALWDPQARTLVTMQTPWSDGPTSSLITLENGGGLLLLDGGMDPCPTAVRTTQPEVPLWERCDIDAAYGAVSSDGSRIAVADGWKRSTGLVLDSASGKTAHSWVLPRGADVEQVAWEDAEHVLFAMSDSYEGRALVSALIRCRVGEGTCERVPTPPKGYITALGGT